MTDPFDPFRDARNGPGIVEIEIEGEQLPMLLRYGDVKRATHDWERYTSDAPFRVPIPEEHDVRRVRQLPIETDPPDHRDYRQVVREPFGRAAATALAPELGRLVDGMLDEAVAAGDTEVVRGFALPLQSHALALMLRMPAEAAEEWISWGLHVFRDPEGSHASELDDYLERELDRAASDPGDDFFSLLAAGEFHGRALTRDEMLGFANLAFAGGRDTLIGLVVNAVAHLAQKPLALERLRAEPDLARTATEELLRFYSPLAHIGRVVTEDHECHGRPIAADERISLGFASANRDDTVFDRADECVLDRSPNRHLAFGHGTHTCLGAPLTRAVVTTLLERMAARLAAVSIVEAEPMLKDLGPFRRQSGYVRLTVTMVERDAV